MFVQGVDKEYDDAEGRVKDMEADLAEYLHQIRRQLGAGKELCYVTVNKDVNLLEIPQVGFCFLFMQQHLSSMWCDIHCIIYTAQCSCVQRNLPSPS